ncbi:type IV secretion system DNA-binding domain-containing protein [Corynebacterium camporealensis]|uniref:type IV secretory system conjugative DNA transfer family protein n=1 Tax=Corynebacterium camporealensis TaxID=161896 RepID=UPI0034CF68FC
MNAPDITASTQGHEPPVSTRKKTSAVRWREIYFNNMTDLAAASGVFEQLCANGMLGTIVLEARATNTGVRCLIGARQGKIAETKQILRSQLDVRLAAPKAPRRPVEMASRFQLRGSPPSTDPARTHAVIRSMFSAAGQLADGEEICLQLLIGRRILPPVHPRATDAGWIELLSQAAKHAVGAPPPKSSRQSTPRSAKTGLDDLYGAQGHLRVGVSGTASIKRSYQLINQMLGLFRVMEASGSRITLREDSPARLNKVGLPWRWTLRFRSCDLPGLSGWPIGEPPLPLIGNLHPKLLPPPKLASTPRSFAITNAPGRDDRVGIPIKDALFHTHLLGPTGSGKSTVLENLILADINAGLGTLVIDPKGDLVSDLLERIPAHRHADVVILDPTSPTPVGFNPLATTPETAHVAADSLLSTFEALFKENWGIRTADVLSASLLTLARHPDANLLWLEPLLTNPQFRKKVLKDSDDPLGVDNFWQPYEALKPERQFQEIAPVLNKLRQIILRPGLRAMLGQASPHFSIDELLSDGKIVLLSLNKGRVGTEAAKLLGALVVSHLWTKILERQSLPARKRTPVTVYIDEVHDFLAGIPGNLADALAQARSLGVGFILANQYRDQLTPAMQTAIDANTRSKIVFGLGGHDAAAVAKRASPLEPADFQLLGKYQIYANLMQSGKATDWFSATTLPPARPIQDGSDLFASSHASYGVCASETEAELLDLLRAPAPEASAPVGRTPRAPTPEEEPQVKVGRTPRTGSNPAPENQEPRP